jgi:hypothetical protein
MDKTTQNELKIMKEECLKYSWTKTTKAWNILKYDYDPPSFDL